MPDIFLHGYYFFEENLTEESFLIKPYEASNYYQFSYLFEIYLARFIEFENLYKVSKEKRSNINLFIKWLKYENEVRIGEKPFNYPKYFKLNHYFINFCEHIFLNELLKVILIIKM